MSIDVIVTDVVRFVLAISNLKPLADREPSRGLRLQPGSTLDIIWLKGTLDRDIGKNPSLPSMYLDR